MNAPRLPSTLPSVRQLREAYHTLSGLPARNPGFATRLQYVADLLNQAGDLPRSDLLVWREPDGAIHHAIISEPFVVGRSAGPPGLAFPEDTLLSRTHFSISLAGEGCVLQDLDSKNGTAVNEPGERVGQRLLRDGDLVLAGNHIFAFLGQRRGE